MALWILILIDISQEALLVAVVGAELAIYSFEYLLRLLFNNLIYRLACYDRMYRLL
jgi:hypothetical protein